MSDHMHMPTWKWEWSINTVVSALTLFAMIAGGGVLWGEVRGQQRSFEEKIVNLRSNVLRLESDSRRLETIEFRVGALEGRVGRTTDSMQTMLQTLNALASDVRSVREALERMENGRPSPRRSRDEP